MQKLQAGFVNNISGTLEHLVSLGRKPGYDVSAIGNVRPPRANRMTKRNRLFARMAAFHPLQNHVVAGLKR